MSSASKVKGSRLKKSTKTIYKDVLTHFLVWLRGNQNNIQVKKFKNVFKFNRRNTDGFTMHGTKYVKMMEEDDNIVTEYILTRRDSHYWPNEQSGLNHFNHLRSALKLKLKHSKPKAVYSIAAEDNLEDFFEGLAMEDAEKRVNEGWESKATEDLPWDVYEAIAKELMQTDIICWTMLLLQWNLVCRGVDLEKINLNHISWEKDMLVIMFTHGKRDGTRKKLRKTRIKANPNKPYVCAVTALTVYLMTRAHDGNNLFEGGAVIKYYERGLRKALESPAVKAALFGNGIDNANKSIHTIRKSSAGHLAGGTGVGVSVLGILLRGGWSIGNVLNRYIKSGKHTDAMIANLLAGLDYMSYEFTILPPHFKKTFALNVDTIKGIFCIDETDKYSALLNKLVPSVIQNYNTIKSLIAGTKFDTVYTLNNLKDYAGQLGPNLPPDKLYFIQPQGMLAITPIHHELHVIKEEIKKSRKDGITAEECDEIIKKRNEELLESFGAKKSDSATEANNTQASVYNNIYFHGINGSAVQKLPQSFFKSELQNISFQQQLLLFLLHNKVKKLTALCHVKSNECSATNPRERKKYKRMTSALHTFVAYMSHYHPVEWKNYMENQTPASVNDLYKVGWKIFVSKVFTDKPEKWKKWNVISASTVAQHKNFSKFCDALMVTMNLELPKKKRGPGCKREWRVKFPSMTIV